MSQILPAGLPTLSQKMARVLSSISFSIASGWSDSANRTVMPWLGSKWREQRVGGAVKLRHRDDVAAHLGEVEHRVVERRLPAGDAQRIEAAFERGDAALEHVGRSDC